MKRALFYCLIISMLSLTACHKSDDSSMTQSEHLSPSQVPAAVITSFNNKYPNAMGQDWELEHGSNYKVKFTIDGQKREAEFAADGTLVREKVG